MENVAQETEKSIAGVIKINEKGVIDHIDGLVRQFVEDTLNALLNAEADTTIWNEGYPVWWHLTNVRLLKEPIPCRGNVGMWELPEDITLLLNGAMRQ